MLEQTLSALAASGGTAVVQAAGTDTWAGLRRAVAKWLSRGDAEREQTELGRLDQSEAALQGTESGDIERDRIRQEVAWQARIESTLESLAGAEREQAAQELRGLLSRYALQSGVNAGKSGFAMGGSASIRAEGGSLAAGVIHGSVHVSSPSKPDPSQG